MNYCNIEVFTRKIIYKWIFSIAMLNYWRIPHWIQPGLSLFWGWHFWRDYIDYWGFSNVDKLMVLVVSTRNLLQPVFFYQSIPFGWEWSHWNWVELGEINEGWRHTNTDRLIGLFHVFDYFKPFLGTPQHITIAIHTIITSINLLLRVFQNWYSPPVRWGLLDFMSAALARPVFPAGPEQQPLEQSVPCRTSNICQNICQNICLEIPWWGSLEVFFFLPVSIYQYYCPS